MRPITIIATSQSGQIFEKSHRSLRESGLVEEVITTSVPLTTNETLNRIIAGVKTDYFLLLVKDNLIFFKSHAMERMLEAAKTKRAGIVYSDYYDEGKDVRRPHPLIDYQFGSVRDDFDFGPIMFFSTEAVKIALQRYGAIPPVRFAGLYDLRLKVSIDNPIHHIDEPLYSVFDKEDSQRIDTHFSYVDPKNTEVQREMEFVFTDYLKKIDTYIPPEYLKKTGQMGGHQFPVEASIIIPVKNRAGTIADAIYSALSQKTDFSFNIIVVDNHSGDGTTGILSGLANKHTQLIHIIPERHDLGIGGCWNEAIYSPFCGRYAVQLDSDDLYSSSQTLQKVVEMLRDGSYAMVIGSYTIVDFNLKEIPPGLIDHREWTDENGHNNALRINGLGAPRAFNTTIIRRIGFLNVSYGEDYAAALHICREYRIGRIFESLYLCRRWEGNTDAALPLKKINENNAFKDSIRTEEIISRQKMNKKI
ncbi:MAG TPA: glycosyltransferase family 2 protein [Syntrophorhabdaceae bacterium]|nr:glycosyltransferase family 2 protein [Syntrophorhabdaceae bacterium]HPP41907.1 glycosyltransferase family 2 protein [Syntrophorhabdaceae bacterium]HRR71799.1 glycosyltransferase family 2 protein [Syntrophorhabdaceae bacterium]HRV21508.1 glycosyltransferase family 2 protein [Syntrophorhabdaceae bacterium]